MQINQRRLTLSTLPHQNDPNSAIVSRRSLTQGGQPFKEKKYTNHARTRLISPRQTNGLRNRQSRVTVQHSGPKHWNFPVEIVPSHNRTVQQVAAKERRINLGSNH